MRFCRSSDAAEPHLQIGFYGWISDFATPAGFIPPALGCASYKPGNPQNANIAEFCDPAIAAPWVPFANGVIVSVPSKRVGNYQYNPQWPTLFDQLWVN